MVWDRNHICRGRGDISVGQGWGRGGVGVGSGWDRAGIGLG